MISPHTPPGTHVVASWIPRNIDEAVFVLVKQQYRQVAHVILEGRLGTPFAVGDKFTVVSIRPNHMAKHDYVVELAEIKGTWSIYHFSPATLPKALTDLLVGKDVPADAMELV